MPRDGSNVYHQPFPNVVTATPIESTVYNGFTNDVAQDLNAPRPVTAGGTGATDADTALTNLSAEKFKQVVTNWDAMVWRAGSFYALSSAVGLAPVSGHAFAGITYYANATDFVCEATDVTDPANPDKYVRVMAAGVWGNWTSVVPATSVSNLGEYTFSNQVTFPPASGTIRFNNATQNATTEIFISHLNPAGGDNSSQIALYLKSGVDVVIQDKDEGSKYKIFTATADPVLSGGDYRVTVQFKLAGADIVNSQRVVVSASGETQRASQRQLIYAAPFDALAYNGMQINGSMDVSQEFGSTAQSVTLSTFKYTLDGWIIYAQGNGTFGCSQNTSFALPSFVNAALFNCGNAFNMAGANDLISVQHRVEGYRWSRLGWGTANAQPITICFWVYATAPGTMSLVIKASASVRSYAVPVTINAGNTWEYKTVTIPGDIAGTWATGNTLGAIICFTYGAGSSRVGTANTWSGADIYAHTGVSNFYATNANVVQITGVVVLPGIEAPSVTRSPLIMRPFDQELVMCQRYLELPFVNIIQSPAAGQMTIPYAFAVTKRSSPAMLTTIAPTYSNASGATLNSSSPTSVSLQFSTSAANGYLQNWQFSADARL
jgi:hypothetical protein